MSTSVEIPKVAPTSVVEPSPVLLHNGGEDAAYTLQGLDPWLKNFCKYEVTLQEITKTFAETKFKAELGTIEQCQGFKVLPEAEQTATVYTLMLHSNQDQIRFFISALQQMIRPDVAKPEFTITGRRSKDHRLPSLNIPKPVSPIIPTPVTAKDAPVEAGQGKSSIVEPTSKKEDKDASAQGLPGTDALNPFHLDMLANAGLSPEAQLLAVQLIMSGVVQPVGAPLASQRPRAVKKSVHSGDANNWRTLNDAKYSGSALHRSGLRASALKSASLKSVSLSSASVPSAGLNSSELDSAGAATLREEDFDSGMLNDVPAWLRSLRLHKYTLCFDGLTWQEMVVLDDAALEAKGVAALGARRRLLRTFEHVRRKMGMEDPDIATPTMSALLADTSSSTTSAEPTLRSAASPSKLSSASPVFVPSSVRGPPSAALSVSVTKSSSNSAT